jgi:N-acetylglutamate synthase/N-acetylornithine aminotransferase
MLVTILPTLKVDRGMIHSNMAALLAFVLCGVLVGQELWQAMLKQANEKSLNKIINGDASANDIMFAMCSGQGCANIHKIRFRIRIRRIFGESEFRELAYYSPNSNLKLDPEFALGEYSR